MSLTANVTFETPHK